VQIFDVDVGLVFEEGVIRPQRVPALTVHFRHVDGTGRFPLDESVLVIWVKMKT